MSYSVGLFGGAFNPPTQGHVDRVQAVMDAGVVDEVWVVPYCRNEYRSDLKLAHHRLEMARLAFAGMSKVKVSDYEIRNELPGPTIWLLKALRADPDVPKYDFYMIIGQDNAESFTTWRQHELVRKMITFIVLPRRAVVPMSDWYRRPPHIFLKNSPDVTGASSTQVRAELAAGRSVERLVRAPVIDYIKRYQLYSPQRDIILP